MILLFVINQAYNNRMFKGMGRKWVRMIKKDWVLPLSYSLDPGFIFFPVVFLSKELYFVQHFASCNYGNDIKLLIFLIPKRNLLISTTFVENIFAPNEFLVELRKLKISINILCSLFQLVSNKRFWCRLKTLCFIFCGLFQEKMFWA